MVWTNETIKDITIETENNFEHLKGEYSSALGIVPFVGAGMSIHFGYPSWTGFLIQLARKQGVEPTVSELLARGEYEEAASALQIGNSNSFNQELENRFSDRSRNQQPLTSGAAGLVPFLAKGPVITTNFDHVLENVFEARGSSFNHNVMMASQPSLVWDYLKRKAPFLLKLHGDADPSKVEGRILTTEQYSEHYEKRTELPSLLREIYSSRPILFLGCSLNKDRTIQLLKEVAEVSLTNHYAIVEAPEDEGEFFVKQRTLRNHKVRPIWYPHGQHEKVEECLKRIVSRPESLTKIYGPERKVAIVYSHLTIAPELVRYIDRDGLAQSGTAGGQEAAKPYFVDESKRNSIKKYFLVPGSNPDEEGQQKCRGTKVACICEVRATAYLSAGLATSEFMKFAIYSDNLTASEPTRIYLGIVSNPPGWEVLKTNPLVRIEGLMPDTKSTIYFALPTGERLHSLRSVDEKHDADVDYGIIVRYCPKDRAKPRSIVCAGLGEFGTSGSAYFLATHFQRIARRLKGSDTNFLCVVRVPGEDDSKAELLGGVPFEENGDIDIQTWRASLFDSANAL